jgi:hypothetical protein
LKLQSSALRNQRSEHTFHSFLKGVLDETRLIVSGMAMVVSLPLCAQEPRHLFHASALAVEGRADDHQIVVLPERRLAYASTVFIRDVDIMNIVHADRIVLRATARQRIGDAETTISFNGSRIDG